MSKEIIKKLHSTIVNGVEYVTGLINWRGRLGLFTTSESTSEINPGFKLTKDALELPILGIDEMGDLELKIATYIRNYNRSYPNVEFDLSKLEVGSKLLMSPNLEHPYNMPDYSIPDMICTVTDMHDSQVSIVIDQIISQADGLFMDDEFEVGMEFKLDMDLIKSQSIILIS